jgi:uncharacterized protein YbaP (TraB family)
MAGLIKSRAVISVLGLGLAIQSLSAAENLPIWELQNTDNQIHLMGSIHVLRAEDYPLPDGIFAAYEQADELFMEIDMDDIDAAALQATMMEMSISPDGRQLKDILGEQDYNKAVKLADDLDLPMGLTLEMLNSFEPWFVAITISQLRVEALGYDPTWGIETQLQKRAAQDGKTITGLETIEEQFGYLDRMDEDAQELFLMQALDNETDERVEIEAMIAAWRSGSFEQLADQTADEFLEVPGLYDALLVQRNRSWIDTITRLASSDKNYLIVVGALHLTGEDSVIDMLEDAGFPAQQLTRGELN